MTNIDINLEILVCGLSKITDFVNGNLYLTEDIYKALFDEIMKPSEGYIKFRTSIEDMTSFKLLLTFNESANVVKYGALFVPTVEAPDQYIITQMRRKSILKVPESSARQKWASDIKLKCANKQAAADFNNMVQAFPVLDNAQGDGDELSSSGSPTRLKSLDNLTLARWGKLTHFVKNSVIKQTKKRNSSDKIIHLDSCSSTGPKRSDLGEILHTPPCKKSEKHLDSEKIFQSRSIETSGYTESVCGLSRDSGRVLHDNRLNKSILRVRSVDRHRTGTNHRLKSLTLSECNSPASLSQPPSGMCTPNWTASRWDTLLYDANTSLDCTSADSEEDIDDPDSTIILNSKLKNGSMVMHDSRGVVGLPQKDNARVYPVVSSPRQMASALTRALSDLE